MPMVAFYSREIKHGDSVLSYRLSELAIGRPTIFGVDSDRPQDAEIELYGESLLAVLHEHMADGHRQPDFQINQPWNRGSGSVSDLQVKEVREFVEMIDMWKRRASERRLWRGLPASTVRVVAYLSMSPTTKNIEPRMATRSGTRQPTSKVDSACTLA